MIILNENRRFYIPAQPQKSKGLPGLPGMKNPQFSFSTHYNFRFIIKITPEGKSLIELLLTQKFAARNASENRADLAEKKTKKWHITRLNWSHRRKLDNY